MAEVIIYGFETSNNFKVRVGLGFKGIDYEFRPIDPVDRREIVRLSGQPFTPVMRHGEVVLFDSGAILRYLEAAFPGTPRLFSDDYDRMRTIESWELFGRTQLQGPLLEVVRQRRVGIEDAAAIARAADAFARAAGRLELALAEREWLVGQALTAADVTTAPVVHRVRASGVLPFPDGLARVRAWADRVMDYDRYAR